MEDRQVKVLLEDIDHKFKTIQEMFFSLLAMKEDVSVLKKDMIQVKEDIAIIKTSLKNKADIQRVEKIEADVKILQQKIV